MNSKTGGTGRGLIEGLKQDLSTGTWVGVLFGVQLISTITRLLAIGGAVPKATTNPRGGLK